MKLIFTVVVIIFSASRASSFSGNVSIVVWGQKGAGISSTVQSILGPATIYNTPDIGNSSGTNILTEFTTPIYNTLSSSPILLGYLKILDVSGLNSNEDAFIMSQLLKHLNSTTIPEFFVLVSGFDDNTFYDENSKFTWMLKKTAKFQEALMSTSYNATLPTSFLVLSKLMKEKRLITEKPDSKTLLFKTSILDFVPNFRSLTRNIVVGENKPELNNLQTKDGFTQLPNLELYPKNLFDKILVSAKSKPDLHQGIQHFMNSRAVPQKRDVMKTTYFSDPVDTAEGQNVVMTFDPDMGSWFSAQVQAIEGGVRDSEVSRVLLKKAFGESGDNYTNSGLLELQLFLQSESLLTIGDIPKSGPELARLLWKMIKYSEKFNERTFKLMRDAFGLTSPLISAPNTKNVTLIIVGKGGTGISSTVQKILGPSAEVVFADSRMSSDTGFVTEYKISFPDVAGSFKIVDVQGLLEGKPIGQERNVLSSLISYLADKMVHDGLDTYQPNFRFIVSNFDDNKFMGRNSNFAKMMENISKLQSVLEWSSAGNAVPKNAMLLTKIISETGKNQRNPEAKLELFSSAVSQFSTIKLSDSPLLGDNMWTQGMQRNGYVTLPNQEIYPGNIFKSLLKMAGGNIVEKSIIEKFQNIRNSLSSYQVVKSYF